ncbi:MAG: T9SS type A sorting domain-containing protein [Prolixibacteraceae bacterium]
MKIYFLVLVLFFTKLAVSSNYYVASNGSDSNNGTTLETPFASIATAVSKVAAGDSILVRGGTYQHNVTIYLKTSGTESANIYLLAYADEKPVLDFSGTAFGKRGMALSANYWTIKGIEMMYAGDNALNISGNFNTIEFCSFHDNKDTGLQLGGGAHDNNIINCDSYFNADPTDYGDADGFAAKLDVGSNNYFYGCRAWFNCDDGWDGYMRGNDDVSTKLENCWTWSNGYFKDGTDAGKSANGNGFKVGGSDDKMLKHNFTLVNCLSFYNKAKGFDQNNNKGDIKWYNCTAYGNKGADYSIYLALAAGKIAEVKNCVLFNGTQSLASFVVQETNSWNANFTVDKSDFLSVDTTGISGPRQADGSLPEVAFMHLTDNSDLVNAGIDLGFPFLGVAPDLGAFETTVETGNGIKQLNSTHGFVAFQSNSSTITIRIELEVEGSADLSLYNLSGRLILKNNSTELKQGLNEIYIPVDLLSGIYLLKMNNHDKSYSTKVMIH